MPIVLDGSNGVTFPSWTTAGRPASPTTSMTGYNTTIGAMEYYDGTAWNQTFAAPLGYLFLTALQASMYA